MVMSNLSGKRDFLSHYHQYTGFHYLIERTKNTSHTNEFDINTHQLSFMKVIFDQKKFGTY